MVFGASGKGPPWSIAASALPKGASVVTSNEAKPWMPRPAWHPCYWKEGNIGKSFKPKGSGLILAKKKTVLNLASRMGLNLLLET
jgi:hypothetical protein